MNDFVNEVYNLYNNECNQIIDDIYNSLKVELNNIDNYEPNMFKEDYEKHMNAIRKKKARWCYDYINDKNSRYAKDLELANSNLKILKERNYSEDKIKEGFRLLFAVDSIEELEYALKKDIIEWRNDVNSYFSQFNKFKPLVGRTLSAAIKNDIRILYFKRIMSKLNEEYSNITRIPSFIGAIGIDTTNRNKIWSGNVEGELGLTGGTERYLTTPDESDELLISLKNEVVKRLEGQQAVEDVMTKIALVQAMKDFTNLDVAIINCFYTDLYNVVNESMEPISIYSLIKKLNLPDNGVSYESVRNSLLKIGSVNMSAYYATSDTKVSLAGGILEVYMKDSEVIVTLGRFLRQLAIMNSTFNFNTDVYSKLSKDSQQIAIWLQKRRLRRFTEGNFEKDMISIYQVAKSIKSQTSNTSLLKKRIDKVLAELIENSLIVSSFEKPRGSIYYYINYVRLPEDIEKKIINKEINSGELIEGANYKTLELV
ncbi:MAG: hypothetical protein RR620_08575 [Clostridium sp.]